MTHATHQMHANSLRTYLGINLAEKERPVMAVYLADASENGPTDHEVALLLGYANSREVSPRITGLRDKGLLHENKKGGRKGGNVVRTCKAVRKSEATEQEQEPVKQFCNHSFAGHLRKVPSKKRKGVVVVVCTNPIHEKPVFYGYQPAGER